MRDVPLEVEAIQREFPFLKEAEPLTSAPPPVLPIQSSMLGERGADAESHQGDGLVEICDATRAPADLCL